MTPGRDMWNTIAICIALNTLYDNFDMITASLLDTRDKTIDQIQGILQSKEAKNLRKRSTGAIKDLAMSFKENK